MTAVIGWLSILLRLVVIGLVAYQVLLVVRAVARARRQRRTLSRGDRVSVVRLSREAVEAKLGRLPAEFPFHLLNLARVLVASGRAEEGIEWLRLADESTGADHHSKPAILTTLGMTLASMGRYEEAESALARASELYIESAHPDFRGGAMQRWHMSTRKYRRRVANARGYVAMLSERFGDARTWYEAVRAIPGAQTRHDRLANLNNLAAASVDLGDLDGAERYVNEVHTLAGDKPWPGQDYFLGTRGDLRLSQGRLKEARSDFTQVLTLRGADPRTLLCLAETAYKEGSSEDAIAYLNRIETPPREAHWRRRLAETLENLAELDDRADHPEAAQKRRVEASKLRGEVPHPVEANEDPLLAAVRSAMAGRRFRGLSTPGAVVLALYLVAGFWLGILILGGFDVVPTAVLTEGAVLVVLLVAYVPLSRWLFGPLAVSSEQTAARIKSPG
jgi:tetratricopeptide (TPR) repeat protein